MSARGNKLALRPAPLPPGSQFVTAVFDFTPGIPDELLLQVGDVIKIIRKVDDFWLQGVKLHNGESGQFPRDFVRDVILPKHSANETLLYALDTFYPEADGDLPFDKGDIIVLERKINNEWGSGRCNSSAKGMFPLNYTDCLMPLTISSLENQQANKDAPAKKEKQLAASGDGLGLARATMNLTAQLEDELSFSVGDEIAIIEVLDDGTWYKGRIGDDIGTFPASFVQLITPLNSPKTQKKQTSNAASLMRTGSKAWKEEELDSVPNNVTNNNNYDSGLEVCDENVSGVTEDKENLKPGMTQQFQYSDEVQSKNIAGATIEPTVAENSSTKEILYTVTAMHKYTRNTDQELSFEKGTEISIFQEVDEHWFMGKVGSSEGYIARAYVSAPIKRFVKQNEGRIPEKDVKKSKNIEAERNTGYVKSTGSRLLNKHHVYTAPNKEKGDPKRDQTESKHTQPKRALAIYHYQATNKFDLTVSIGDVLYVIRNADDNWVEVNNEAGKKGIVPNSYIKYAVEGGAEIPKTPVLVEGHETSDSPMDSQEEIGEASAQPHITQTPHYPMPVLHEDTVSNGPSLNRMGERSNKKLVALSSPKPVVPQKPRNLPIASGTQETQPKLLQKSLSVDSARRGSPNDLNGGVHRSNSNPQSHYTISARDTRSNLKAWQVARKMSSPTGSLTPPNERSVMASDVNGEQMDVSDSKKANFQRTANRSASMREKRSHRRHEDVVQEDSSFVKIKSDSDLSVDAVIGKQRPRTISGENRKSLKTRRQSGDGRNEKKDGSSKGWYIDSASTTSTGSSSSYGDSRATHSVQSDISSSDTSSATSRKSTPSSRMLRRSAPPVPPHCHDHIASTPEQPQNTSNPPSLWSPPVPTRKQSLQHESKKHVRDASPETPRNALKYGTLVPSRPAPELPPRTPGMSPVKKIPPMRPANPPRSRSPNTKVINDGTQERVRNVTSRGLKDKIEKVRSDIEDYSRMKTDLENLYQGTLDGKERREISENMEFVKANLKRLQNEFHSLIEGQEDHIYESLEQHMIPQPASNGTNTFERLPAPPLPPSFESPGSIRKRRNDKRLLVAEELVNTERDFLMDVTVTIEDIMNELIDRQIHQTTVTTLFANILQVKEFSERLLRELEEAYKNESSNPPDYAGATIGQVFIDNNPEMKDVYMPYCRNHDDAMTLLEKLHEDLDFMQAVQYCLDNIKNKVNVFDLGSFLIKPVQRFLKYPLLLEELIKLTDAPTRDSPSDHDKLILAHKLMQSLAKDINEDKRIKDLGGFSDL